MNYKRFKFCVNYVNYRWLDVIYNIEQVIYEFNIVNFKTFQVWSKFNIQYVTRMIVLKKLLVKLDKEVFIKYASLIH